MQTYEIVLWCIFGIFDAVALVSGIRYIIKARKRKEQNHE